MMRMQLPVALLGLLLPMMASCASPPGRYQPATIQDRDGVPCFGVPDTRETRTTAPIIARVSVRASGAGGVPVWEHIFLRSGTSEPALPPSQCLVYGHGDASAPALRAGTRYEVVMSGYTPGTPGKQGEAQKRVFGSCFDVVDVAGKGVITSVVADCATARASGTAPVPQGGR